MIMFCKSCHEFFSECRMATADKCDRCAALEYLKHEGGENHSAKEKKPESKETAGGGRKDRPRNKVLPVAGERGLICRAPDGVQLLLPNIWPEASACQGQN